MLILVTLAACLPVEPPSHGGQSGDEGSVVPTCEEVLREELVDLDVAADGFWLTPQDVMDRSGGTWAGTLTLEDATTAAVSMTLTHDGTATLLRYRELTDTGAPREPSPVCPALYEIPSHVALADDAGRLDVSAAITTYRSDGSEYPWFEVVLPLDTLGGTATPTWDPAAWDTTTLRLTLEWRMPEVGPEWAVAGTARWRSVRDDGEAAQREDFGAFAFGPKEAP